MRGRRSRIGLVWAGLSMVGRSSTSSPSWGPVRAGLGGHKRTCAAGWGSALNSATRKTLPRADSCALAGSTAEGWRPCTTQWLPPHPLQWPAYAWSKESWPGKHISSAEASSRCVETRLLLAAAGANVSALNQGGVTDG